jgi:hypothetical protein
LPFYCDLVYEYTHDYETWTGITNEVKARAQSNKIYSQC